MSHINLHAIKLSTDGRIIHPLNYTQNQLVFSPNWINDYEKNTQSLIVLEKPKVETFMDLRRTPIAEIKFLEILNINSFIQNDL